MEPKKPAQEDKASKILKAAQSCFLNYGFKKTTLLDIAQQANMSRPSLYLHFDNKETIFCALVEQIHQQTLSEVRTVLTSDEYIFKRLEKAFESRTIALLALVVNSTHGDELLDINSKVAAKITSSSVVQFIELLTQALETAESNREIQLKNLNLTPKQTAEFLVYSARGLKESATSVDDYRLKLQQAIAILEKAISFV
jgi:AcrR family transcriptional regulator